MLLLGMCLGSMYVPRKVVHINNATLSALKSSRISAFPSIYKDTPVTLPLWDI